MGNKLTIACNKSNLTRIREFIVKSLDKVDMGEIESHKVVLAVDEICANMIIHSNQCNPTKKIDVIVDISPKDQIIFTIKDQGISFDMKNYSEPTLDEIIASGRKGGMGLILVKRIMDKIEFSSDKNYNICRLTKKLR